MRADVLQRLGLGALREVKINPTFPYKTGRLRENATRVEFIRNVGFSIVFDTTIAPYIKYLEYGTKRSSKHIGFIRQRATQDVINYLAKHFQSKIAFVVRNNEGNVFRND